MPGYRYRSSCLTAASGGLACQRFHSCREPLDLLLQLEDARQGLGIAGETDGVLLVLQQLEERLGDLPVELDLELQERPDEPADELPREKVGRPDRILDGAVF